MLGQLVIKGTVGFASYSDFSSELYCENKWKIEIEGK